VSGKPKTLQPNFSGPVYDESADYKRLSFQHERIRDLMLDGKWRTIREIALRTCDPENSIQAQLRHLRKPRFGGFIVDRRRRSTGVWSPVTKKLSPVWEYHVRPRREDDPPYAGGKSGKALKVRAAALEELVEEACNALESTGDLFANAAAKVIRKRMEEL
jgi:hypothetical protein